MNIDFTISMELIDSALTYDGYIRYLRRSVNETSQSEAAEKMRVYTSENLAIMKEYDERTFICPNLENALNNSAPTIWLVLTEGWCGDAAYTIPIMAALEKLNPKKLRLYFLFRDHHPALMDAHLTGGARAIPKLIAIDETGKVLDTWGPRPSDLKELMMRWTGKGFPLSEIIPKVKAWYDADDSYSLKSELMAMIKNYSILETGSTLDMQK